MKGRKVTDLKVQQVVDIVKKDPKRVFQILENPTIGLKEFKLTTIQITQVVTELKNLQR